MSAVRWGAALLIIWMLDIFLIEPYWVKTARYQMACPRLRHDLRILFLSDFQLRDSAGYRERRVLNKMSVVPFDLIAIGGDVFDTKRGMQSAIPFLAQLAKRAPAYVVLGNWEHWSHVDLSSYAQKLKRNGATLLVNSSEIFRWHGQSIRIAGVDDPSLAKDDLAAALLPVDPNGPTILLAHAPAIFRKSAQEKIELTLAGHTHGGQVRLPFVGPLWLPPGCDGYVYGVYQIGISRMIVTSGVGTSVLPGRFLCRPEIVLIELHAPRS